MNILKKNCVKRALRTFLQTAVGYIAVNIAATDLTVKSAVLGLAVSAISAGMGILKKTVDIFP